MQTISQFIENINTINTNSFILKSNLDPLLLMSEYPKAVSDIIQDPTLSQLIEMRMLLYLI